MAVRSWRGWGGVAVIILTLLASAGQAQALSTPSQPAISPVAQTAYVSWNGVTGATSYRLLRSSLLRNGSWSSDAPVYEGSSTVFIDAGRTPMTTYRYKVRAQNATDPASAYSSYGGVAIPPFTAASPWNDPATVTGTGLSDTQKTDLGGAQGLDATGTPDNPDCGAPVYFGATGDPTTTNVIGLHTNGPNGDEDWSPHDDWNWTGGAIPIPPNTDPETCDDGHLAIVNATRTTEYDFWHATAVSATAPTSITAQVIAQINLTGVGYASMANGQENSARGSGVPLADTAVRGEEVYYGIFHALGITLPGDAATDIQNPPASHSDGHINDSTHLGYGDRFCLRSNFTESGSLGRINVIRAMKVYGVYVVDQGGRNVEIDAFDPYDPGGFFAAAGFNTNSLNDITSTDYVPCS